MQCTAAEGEDRQIHLVIRELGRYQVVAAGLQETKWFGNAMYKVGESIALTAGRLMPQAGQPGREVRVWQSFSVIQLWLHGKGVEKYRKHGADD